MVGAQDGMSEGSAAMDISEAESEQKKLSRSQRKSAVKKRRKLWRAERKMKREARWSSGKREGRWWW